MGEQIIDKESKLPIFTEFQKNGQFTFLLYKFHNYFDGLLRLDILKQLEAKIDINNKKLMTKNSIIDLKTKPNFTSNTYAIPNNTKTIVKLPTDHQNGNIYIPETKIKENLFISEGLYTTNNWFSNVEVTNDSNLDQILHIEQPIKVEPYDTNNYIEVNMLEPNTSNTKQSENIKLEDLIRTEHLNNEEKHSLLKTCKNFYEIFHQEGQNLSFTNKIKHRIITTDNIPVHTKSYRYPYIHKEEVQTQISKMLNEGIIRSSYSPWSAPVWIVPKKLDASGKQKWRLVIDFRIGMLIFLKISIFFISC